MAGLILMVIVGGVCVGGWRYRSKQRRFRYQKLDAELAALRRAIADDSAS